MQSEGDFVSEPGKPVVDAPGVEEPKVAWPGPDAIESAEQRRARLLAIADDIMDRHDASFVNSRSDRARVAVGRGGRRAARARAAAVRRAVRHTRPERARSAVNRPKHRWAYGEEDLHALAAAYAFGLARNHAFSDGNKRVAALVSTTFLVANGKAFAAPDAEFTALFVALAAGQATEEEVGAFFRKYAP